MANMKSVKKTTKFGPFEADWRRPVYWLIDGKWVHKGWLMPEVGPFVAKRGH